MVSRPAREAKAPPPSPAEVARRLDRRPRSSEEEGEDLVREEDSPTGQLDPSAVPEEQSGALRAISSQVTYGWGVIPVQARIGETEWKTSLFPKAGRYLVPIRVSVQRSEHLGVGDTVTIRLEISM